MARVTIDDSILTSTANTIREKLGTSERISPLNFPSLIESIEGGSETIYSETIFSSETRVDLSRNAFEIPHLLAHTPKSFLITALDDVGDTTIEQIWIAYYSNNENIMIVCARGGGNQQGIVDGLNYVNVSFNENKMYCSPIKGTNKFYLKENHRYLFTFW